MTSTIEKQDQLVPDSILAYADDHDLEPTQPDYPNRETHDAMGNPQWWIDGEAAMAGLGYEKGIPPDDEGAWLAYREHILIPQLWHQLLASAVHRYEDRFRWTEPGVKRAEHDSPTKSSYLCEYEDDDYVVLRSDTGWLATYLVTGYSGDDELSISALVFRADAEA
jgi:hypothetical protein